MQRALYDPDCGYYARNAAQVGKAGDFFTSVSVGPLFGELLARRFLQWRSETMAERGRWRIMELGAHDGKLAADVLAAIARLDNAAFTQLEYLIAEPLAVMQAAQSARLANFAPVVRWVGTPDECSGDPLPGIVFGNELLDALPFHVVTWHQGGWRESGVAKDPAHPERCVWCDLGPPTAGLAKHLARIDTRGFPDGYRTEVRTGFTDLHRAIACALTHGLVIWFDYGFARPEYYDPARVHGTLRTFSNHRAGDDPLADPGACDITAHVDFTAVADCATEAGMVLAEFHNQGAWLTHHAAEWLREIENRPDPVAIRQFQTLTHPTQLGARFHVIELAVGRDAPPNEHAIRRCGING